MSKYLVLCTALLCATASAGVRATFDVPAGYKKKNLPKMGG